MKENNNIHYEFYTTVEERVKLLDDIKELIKEAEKYTNNSEEFTRYIGGIHMNTEEYIDLVCK